MELVGAALAWFAPGRDQVAGGGEPVYSGIPVAVGDVKISIGSGDHLGDVVKRSSGTRADITRLLAAGIRILTLGTDGKQGFSVQGALHGYGAFPVGEIGDVVLDEDAVGVVEHTLAP